MANLKITLVKSLNGRLEKHIATAASPWAFARSARLPSSRTTPRPAARSLRSAICCRLPKLNKEENRNEAP